LECVQGHDSEFIHLLYNGPIRKRYNYKESLIIARVVCRNKYEYLQRVKKTLSAYKVGSTN